MRVKMKVENVPLVLTIGLALWLPAQRAECQPSVPRKVTQTASQTSGTPVINDLPIINWQSIYKHAESRELSSSGDEAAQQKAWQSAIGLYKQALDVWKDNDDADYGLARCYDALGDKAKEIGTYRAGIYNGEAKPDNIRETNTVKLMNYVLLLSQAGQADEAVYVYNDTAKKMNDYEKVSNLGFLLPVFGSGPDQATYTPTRLQAMAHVALGVPSLDNQFLTDKEKLAHLEEAVRLAPDCADTYYHLGAYLERLAPAQSQAAFAKSAKLDSAVPGAFVKMEAEKLAAEKLEAERLAAWKLSVEKGANEKP